MKIGIVSATYLPSRNGVATSTALFVRGLRTLGHEVRLFVPEHPHAHAEEGVYHLPSARLNAPRDYPILLPITARTARRLPLGDLELIHTMHPFVAGRTALNWARRRRLPLVFTAHTRYHAYLHYLPAPRQLARWAVERHVRDFASKADLVLVPGQAMARVLRAYGYHQEVHVLANPIDLERFRAVDASWVRSRLGISEGAPLLVFVGRLAPEKNLSCLLRAFGRISHELKSAQLLFIGDGPLRAELQAQAAGSAVHFLGGVDNARLAPYLAAADLFVSASVSETGSPMALLEALAAGTPAVTARATDEVNSLVRDGENGVTCAPDERALSAAVLSLLRDPHKLARLREGARASVRAFAVERQARRLEQHYQRLLGHA